MPKLSQIARLRLPCEQNCDEYREHERLASELPHADAEDAGASFYLALDSGWIDGYGNVLCRHNEEIVL
jgi:hypothetical protein